MHIYEYRGLNGCKSVCGLDFIVSDKRVIVLLTELPENPGTSITNAIESLATDIRRKLLADFEVARLRWVEYYPATWSREQQFDEVTFQTFKDGVFAGPRWERLEIRSVSELTRLGVEAG